MFVLIVLSFAYGATFYNFGSSARPGPGYFPFGLGILLALLGALILSKALTIETEGGDPIGEWAWRPLALILGAIVISGVALPRLGLIVTLPILIFVSSFGSEEFHWRDALIMSVVLTVGS